MTQDARLAQTFVAFPPLLRLNPPTSQQIVIPRFWQPALPVGRVFHAPHQPPDAAVRPVMPTEPNKIGQLERLVQTLMDHQTILAH